MNAPMSQGGGKVAILQCDSVLEKFQRDHGDYPEMIIANFKAIKPDLEFEVFDVTRDIYPSVESDFDFYVITGSKASVYDELDWIQTLINYIKQLDSMKQNIFGICFGHQVIAKARNCRVEKSNKGWGVGVSRNTIQDRAIFRNKSLEYLQIIVSHQDQVLDVDESARVIASSEFCPFFMVLWSEHIISIQGHPEWTTGYSQDLMNDRRDRIPADVIESGIQSLSLTTHNKEVNYLVLDYFKLLN